MNTKKTKYMIFRSSRKTHVQALDLRIDGSQLDVSESYEYLGLTLDSHLTFEQHIGKLIAACNHKLFTLAKIRKYLDERSATNIYKALIMSKLSYCCIFYGDARKTVADRLQRLQNRALRICALASRYTTNLSLHQKCKVLPLNLWRKMDMFPLMFKLHKNSKMSDEDSTVRPNTRYQLTNDPTLITPRNDRFLRSVSYAGPKLWASLPREVKDIGDMDKFKTTVRRSIDLELA